MFESLTKRTPEEIVTDALTTVLGVCLALTPWALGFANEATAAWDAWIVGIATAVMGICALVAFGSWEDWASLALGVWAIVAPWLLGFAPVDGALYTHVVVGVIVAALSAINLWVGRHRPLSTA